MKNIFIKNAGILTMLLGLLGSFCVNAQADVAGAETVSALKEEQAVISAGSAHSMILSVAKAGNRIVAVGDRGTVRLSDDGIKFRQAKSVPTQATLTAVTFVDDKEGWAVGHWGVILHTSDGGENWTLQRDNLKEDRPFFTVWFSNKENGIAAGLWSTMLATTDGGVTWNPVTVPAPKSSAKADRNLLRIFASEKGTLLIAAEAGTVYRSTDKGATWVPIETGNRGSFWTGICLKNGVIIIGGLRGNMYRSVDDGKTWTRVDSGTKSSITDIIQLPDGKIQAVGLDGLMLGGDGDGKNFTATQRDDRLSLTAMTFNEKSDLILFSKQGLVH